ncbi:MAG: hypothetical protein JW900_00210 [Anaerolineae bacterium]|nr:hypothetical protein [Anaerolineae bacterium]
MKKGWLLLLALLLAACVGGDVSWNEDFASPGAWQVESDATAQVGVQDGVLRVYVIVPNQLAWATASQDLRDFHLTVEATQVAGPDDNEYGVLLRMEDSDNFYRFSISGDGYFLVSKFVDGTPELLGGNWTPTEAIRQGQATNVIEVTAQGSALILVVNGQELARVEDRQFSHGNVGLYAGTFYQGGVEIHFDNLHVTPP